MTVILTEQLTRRYGRRVGVERLSISVPAGTLFGFLGPNGSGKTTTIRVLLGLLKASEGSAAVLGFDSWRDSHRIKAEVGYLPGDLRLYPWLTCRESISIFGRARGRDLSHATLELAEDFDLEPDVRVRTMSRGMRQKLGLILALAHHPQLLILDEPTTALDPLMQEKLYRHLRALAGAGHTIFFSSHTLSEVEKLCDRVAILREGKLVADETLEALRDRARRVVTIHWQDTAKLSEITPPQCLDLIERGDRQWEATLAGPAMELVRWCAGQPIEDVAIGQPDLGRLFQEYYAEPEKHA
ncbi:MAG: ABC transporter ATP-binding protein [Planctomycetota bacterium]|jgi:ABC-2 type transport system ATP-binding protein